MIESSVNVNAQQTPIPSWIKNTALWWGQGKISDDEFIKAIQWLVSQGIIVIPSNQPTVQTSISQQSVKQSQTSSSLIGYFPTRNDVRTEWTMSDPMHALISNKINNVFWFHGNNIIELYDDGSGLYTPIVNSNGNLVNVTNIVTVTGFSEGYVKVYSYYNNGLTIGIYRFDSSDNALGIYNTIISKVKNVGGYKEEPVVSTNGDTCFGAAFTSYYIRNTEWCYKNNILFTFHNMEWDDDTFTKMIEITANKIS
jgi:hypothetical protein